MKTIIIVNTEIFATVVVSSANTMDKNPMIIAAIHEVFLFGCTMPKIAGSALSFDIP